MKVSGSLERCGRRRGEGGSVTTAQSGPGTASLGVPAAKHTSIHPIWLTVAGMVTLTTSLEQYPTPKAKKSIISLGEFV